MPQELHLLLDAGGTFVFIDQDYLSHLAQEQGFAIAAQRLYEAHYRFVHSFDSFVDAHRAPPSGLGKSYPQALLELVGLPPAAAESAGAIAEEVHKEKSLWTFTFPWATEALDRLRAAGHRLSVISNADGRVEQQLRQMRLDGYFERVYDSEIVGSSKPEPDIFELALRDLGLRPAETLYVGDMFYIDVLGANRAGIAAVHLDPLSLYDGWPGEHIDDLRLLPEWLRGYLEAPDRYDTLPLRDAKLGADWKTA
jgi:putative hydrolase of the HAD superfamily